jgi:hypothetical protein
LVETSCTGGSAAPADLPLCPRVCLDDCYAANARLMLAEKTSVIERLERSLKRLDTGPRVLETRTCGRRIRH